VTSLLGIACVVVSVVGVCGSLGCRSRRAPVEIEVAAPNPSAAIAASSALPPVDRVTPGELAEGTERAFGLPLPRVMVVRGRFVDSFVGEIDQPPARVANFIRQRVSADRVVTGPSKTVFPRAIVLGQPGVELAIQVIGHGGSTELRIDNLSLVKMTPGLTEEERWRRAGLKPDGTLLDPTHLQ